VCVCVCVCVRVCGDPRDSYPWRVLVTPSMVAVVCVAAFSVMSAMEQN
jgi:hypothetical protein